MFLLVLLDSRIGLGLDILLLREVLEQQEQREDVHEIHPRKVVGERAVEDHVADDGLSN